MCVGIVLTVVVVVVMITVIASRTQGMPRKRGWSENEDGVKFRIFRLLSLTVNYLCKEAQMLPRPPPKEEEGLMRLSDSCGMFGYNG